MKAPRPWNLVAELTYRCPLRCPYCSNPLDFRDVRDGLDAPAWRRVFVEAAELGVVHVGLTGGEPTVRADLEEIVAAAAGAGLYTHLVTAGVPIDSDRLGTLQGHGLRSVQVSIQDCEEAASDAWAGARSFTRKLELLRSARAMELAVTLNVVLHRGNLDRTPEIIRLARSLDVDRLELANVQYEGWALPNRAALLPTATQLEGAARAVREAKQESERPEILFVLPDYFADRPKPCMGGWGRVALVVAPDGSVLPCHAARDLPGLEFWKAQERGLRACWEDAPGMNAFRGEAWMREPCRTCPERTRDFGGCRCQAFRLIGDAAATDPACRLSPHHRIVADAREEKRRDALVFRGGRASEARSEP